MLYTQCWSAYSVHAVRGLKDTTVCGINTLTQCWSAYKQYAVAPAAREIDRCTRSTGAQGQRSVQGTEGQLTVYTQWRPPLGGPTAGCSSAGAQGQCSAHSVSLRSGARRSGVRSRQCVQCSVRYSVQCELGGGWRPLQGRAVYWYTAVASGGAWGGQPQQRRRGG